MEGRGLACEGAYIVFNNFRLTFIWLSKAVCYEGLIYLESDEREGQGGERGRGGEENMAKQSILFSNFFYEK